MQHHHRYRGLVYLVLITTLVSWSVPLKPLRATSTIMFGEVAWAGSSLSPSDEWIELWNPTDSDQSLDGYHLIGASDKPLFFASDALILAHGTYLISNYETDNEKSALAGPVDLTTTTLSLSNTGFHLFLNDPDGISIDHVGDDGPPIAGSSDELKTSMVRQGDVWISSSLSAGFDPGIMDIGTPGICDECYASSSSEELEEETPPDIIEPDEQATTTEPVIETETTDDTPDETVTETETTSTQESVLQPHDYPIRLNKFMPQPEDGEEWIEVTLINTSTPLSLEGVFISDSQNIIFTFSSTTLDENATSTRIFLSSSKLNNDGDNLSLYDPDGNMLDEMSYDASEKGKMWLRRPQGTGDWIDESELETDVVNNQQTVEPISVITPPTIVNVPVVPTQATSTSSVTQKKKKITTTIYAPRTSTSTSTISAPTSTLRAIVLSSLKTKKTSTQTSSSTKKTATQKKTTPLMPITFDMIQQEIPAGVHVQLRGRVGSPAGLLSAHRFILLAPDGRGLIVAVPTSRKLPEMDQEVVVTGSLTFNKNNVPELHMTKDDVMTLVANVPDKSVTRTADLLAPSEEDAWSLIQVQGKVKEVHAATFVLDLDDVEVSIEVKSLLHYRVQRLAVGDVVRVTGLLNLDSGAPRILPRGAEEIELLEHPSPSTSSSATTSRMPADWKAMLAAGLAIAGTEGVKQLHKQRKKKQLEHKLQQTLA